jgi:mgtE-like transporter
MEIVDKDFGEILTSQTVSIIGGILVGVIIVIFAEDLLLIPGMLILLPGFLEMRGNISGSFASRLSSGLFLGVIKPNRIWTHIIRGNLVGSFLEALVVSSVLGLTIFLFNYLFVGIFMPGMILVPIIAAIIANSISVPITLLMTFHLFKKGHDPNNIMGPFVTSTGDIISILSLIVALVIV